MSEYTVGRIRRSLEKLGYVVSNNFSHNPFDRKKYSTLDYYRIAVETGWNPLGLDLNRDYKSPPQFTKGLQLRGRHLSDSTALVYPTDAPVESESLKLPKIDDCATLPNASSNNATMHSTLLPTSSIYKELPNTSKSNPAIDLKIDRKEADKEVGSDEISTLAQSSPTSSVRLQKALSGVASASSQEENSAATSLDGDEKIKAAQQYIATLNAAQERIERDLPQDRKRSPKPIRIKELDEEVQEILWQYQATLEQLNVDLHAERLQRAILDNPYHLENAILALSEESAKGVKTMENATGYLYNALRSGWKPRQSKSSTSWGVQVYTPPPQMLTQPIPPTLEQLVAQKRVAWQNAIILRPNIKAWVEQTQGVIMTPDGPALADAADTPSQTDKEPNATNTPSQAEPEPNAQENPVTPTVDEANSHQENACNPQLDSNPPLSVEPSPENMGNQPQPAVQQVDNSVSHQTPPEPDAGTVPQSQPPNPSPTVPEAKQKQPAEEELENKIPEALSSPPTNCYPYDKTRSFRYFIPAQMLNRRLQPVEILTSAGEWVAGYFVHSCIAVANLIEQERRYTLFDALGQSYRFLGQIRPPQDNAGAT
ncbi:hypothetical protein C7Y66_21160 [Chroococcidiopsis sp. CCALA 051]|nr:hypothetical protein C7Y66_21160 [Chroococcidiopsis sp. CCALA 051]